MKNNYLVLLAFFFFAIGFSQSTLVTIDRANVIGPTATGNDPSISSVGIIRGAGVIQHTGSSNFSTRNWDEASLANAEANNEYLQWSVTSNASNDIEITELDLKLRRSTSGPVNWQLFYSLDNFATTGIAVNALQSASTTTTIYNFNSLNINSGISGTITFRIYAWGSTTSSGWFRVIGETAWSDFGISNPGIRLLGNITTTTPNSTESNIVSSNFDPTDNINYIENNATSGLTTSNSIQIGEFLIQDGGNDLLDSDALGTALTDLSFTVNNFEYIAALALFDGTTNIGEINSVSGNIDFSAINSGSGLIALDDNSKAFAVYATFKNIVNDNQQIELIINTAVADAVSGSTFTAFDAGGASTPIFGDDNRIEVIVSALTFDQQPTNSFQFEIMTPFPTVLAVDDNGSHDLDYNSDFSVIAAGSLEPSIIEYTMINGFATLNTIIFSEQETETTLLTFGGGLISAISNPFDIDGPLITIAIQDFDGSLPEWTYATDVPTFDNGWGIDGYFGVIDIVNASPLDNNLFSNNILGENDLNDEGNGTSGFATITFVNVDVSSFENVGVSFEWDVENFTNNSDDVRYNLVLDGIPQASILLFDGNGPVESDEGIVRLDIPDGTTTVGLQLSIRDNGVTHFSGFDNFKLTSAFDGLLYVDNGWSPNAPSNTTGSDNAYVLDGTYNIGTNIQVNNLYVDEAATTIVSFGQSIKANTGIVNFGVIELNSASTSYSSLISNNVRGEVIYNRHVNQLADTGSSTGKNDLIAAPVTNTNQTFLEFRTANPDVPSGTIDGVSSFLFGPFDKDTNDYINYTTADDGSLIEAGIGYRTASTAATGSAFRFVGNVETTTKLVPIAVGTGTDFNLIGNPYPSYIKLSDFLSDNNSEFSASNSGVYGYDGSATDGFTIWNQAYSDANPSALIAPGQGFLVTSKVGGGTIIFDAASRSIGTTDDFVVGRVSEVDLAHVKLEMTSDTDAFRTDIYFNNNATLSMDAGYDSGMFQGQAPEFAIFSHLVTDNSGLDLAVQSVNYTALNTVVIPLGVNANQGEQLTIGILEMDIPEGIEVYLEDTLTNTFTLLNTSEYVFTPSTNLLGTGRFFLRFTADALSTSENNFETIQIYTTKTPKILFIKGALENNTTVEIYDIQGRMILNSKLDTSRNSNQIDISGFTSGIYVVKLNNGLQQKSKKVIIK
ncbi:T9SS type A sorting domain-containing protein [Psychroserpens burtonensis]|uniref:T9SS type A sorting domain-containing protein n=1 Tax=Psychroserpens burtonensis TaxID=49278 RepID=UPI000413D5CD|nr:T9SS type A sorting domain-containing protein [Psychroserpens burtonensis]